MKKVCFFICSFMLITLSALPQQISELGQLNKEEIEMKKCSFDKDANAVILLNEAYSNYDDDDHLVTIHHVRIKILSEKGIDEANINIPFYRKKGFEKIDKVEGQTINIGSSGELIIEKLDRKSIYTKEITERYGRVSFAFPAVKVGSILDYKYRSTMKHYGGLDSWNFQDELPVVSSKYNLVILPNTEFAYVVNKRAERDVVILPDSKEGSIYFEMRDIPGLQYEPYMDAPKDYLQRVTFQLSGYKSGEDMDEQKNYMTSWNEVDSTLLADEIFGLELKKDIRATEVAELARSKNTAEGKMTAVYNYVRNNMNWDGIYSKYSQSLKEAWKKRSGTSGDINLVLVNLLVGAGLEAYPILISERSNGKVNKDFPFIDQFNTVMACVVINGKKYYLDATDKLEPSHITPFDILNTTGFIVKEKGGELVDIINDSLQYKEDINVNMQVSKDAMATGSIKVISKDYARLNKLQDYAKNHEKFVSDYFSENDMSLKITKSEMKDVENDLLPFGQEFEFSTELKSSGDYKYITLNFFPGFTKNPFISDNRFTNINFGYKSNNKCTVIAILPPDFVIEDLPKPVMMVTRDKNIIFQRQVTYNKVDNSIIATMSIEFKSSLYPADEYPSLKDIYKKIFGYLKEPVLLKKK